MIPLCFGLATLLVFLIELLDDEGRQILVLPDLPLTYIVMHKQFSMISTNIARAVT